jgi:2-hydroxy-6-oxonona-2,4-dienedioate hydrolase
MSTGGQVNDARFVDVNGTRTRYFEAGSGEPLVLIHGGSFGYFENSEDWELNLEGLAQDFHVFAFDKIGTGYSDNPPTEAEYLIGTTVQHAYDFIQTMGLGRAHVAGHSRGGYTATRLALEHPEVVETLFIVDSSSLMAPHNPQYDQWDEEAKQIADLRERYRYLIAVNSYSGDHITDSLLDSILEIESLPKTLEAKRIMEGGKVIEHNRDLVERQAETHEWIRAGGIKCPTLIIWGYDDPSATMDRCGIPCMRLILPSVPRSAMHIINHAGHLVFREQPEEFNDAIRDFVRLNRSVVANA